MPRLGARSGTMVVLACLVFSILPGRAAESVDTKYFKVNADGTFTVSQIPFGIVVYNPSYATDGQRSVTIDKGFPLVTPGKAGPTWKLQGVWQPRWGGSAIKFTETIERLGEKSLHVVYIFESGEGAALNIPHLLAFQFELPAEKHAGKTVLVDGAEVPLSEKVSYDNWGPGVMSIPLPEGRLVIRGDLKIRIQDDRPWSRDFFKVWLAIAQAPYTSKTATLDLVFDYAPTP